MDSVFGIVDSTYEPAARCVVWANEIGPGEGLTVRYGVRTLRFKCRTRDRLLSQRHRRFAFERVGLRLKGRRVATRHGQRHGLDDLRAGAVDR